MAIEIIQSVTSITIGADVSVSLTGIQEGDLAIAVHSVDYSLASNPNTPGFEKIDEYDLGDGWAQLWTKTLDGSESTVTFSGTNNRKSLSIIVLRGAGINVTPALFGSASANVSSTIPAVTPTVAGTIHLAFYGTEDKHNPTVPTGWTELTSSTAGSYDTNRTEIWKWNNEALAANTTSGTQSVSGSNSGGKAVWRVAIEPVSAFTNVEVNLTTPTGTLAAIEPVIFIDNPYGVTVDLTTATMSGNAFEPTVSASVNVAVDLDTVSASVQAFEPTVDSKQIVTKTIYANDFAVNKTTGAVSQQTAIDIKLGETGAYNQYGFFLFDLPADLQQAGLISAEFVANVYGRSGGAGGGTLNYVAPITSLNTAAYHNSVVGDEVSVGSVFGPTNVAIDLDVNTFEGVRVRGTAPSSNYVAFGTSENTTQKSALVLTYEILPLSPTIDLDTPTVSIAAVEPTIDTIDPVSVTVDLATPAVSLQAYDAGFEEIRTTVLIPSVDGHRAQGATTWNNASDTLQISYNPATNLSDVIVPEGTAAQKAVINAALERFDFPLEVLKAGIQAKYGRNYVPVTFGELSTDESGGTVLGQYLPNGTIVLDTDTEFASITQVRHYLIHEIGHLVDDVYLTNAMRVSIWNALHPDPADHLAPGTQVTNGVILDHGHGWSVNTDYLERVSEGFANAFVRAYSDVSYNYYQFSHYATVAAAEGIRAAITPTQSAQLGPFPTRTPAARLQFGALPASLVTGTILSATLNLNVSWTTGGQHTVRFIEPNGRTQYDSSEKVVALSMGQNNIDVADILDPNRASIVHIGNVKTTSTQTLSIRSVEDATAGTDPSLTVRYVVDAGATVVDAETATLGIEAYEPSEVYVEVSPNATVDVETANVVANASLTADASISIVVSADDTDTVLVGAYDADIELNNSAVVDLDTPRILVTRIPLTDVNGEPVVGSESEDPYFVATMETLVGVRRGFSGGSTQDAVDSPIGPEGQVWLRMNETSGTVARDRLSYLSDDTKVDGSLPFMNLNNVTIGLKDGPEGRHHYYFNGDAYAQQITADQRGPSESGLEFTFRTTKKTQFIMGNSDEYGNLSVQSPNPWELWMVDGRLEIRTWRWVMDDANQFSNLVPNPTTTAFTDLADGEWHHVVLQHGYESWRREDRVGSGWTFELTIDSRLEMRRRTPTVAVAGFPDYIGGRSSLFYDRIAVTEVPRSQWFVGDMTELVYRYGRALSADEIARQRDTIMGVFPYYAETPSIKFQTQDAVVKGNKPRLLVLHFGQAGMNRSGTFDVDPQPASTSTDLMYTGAKTTGTVDFPFIGWGESDAPNMPSYSTGEYLWTVKNVAGNYQYKDPVTDNYRLINLDIDVNMDEYDVISIVGYPTNSYMWETNIERIDNWNVEPFIPARKQVENLLAQVREQVVHHGKGLYLNDPFSAIALGIVDKVDFVPNFKEGVGLDTRLGAFSGLMDWYSYIIDPFNGTQPGLDRALQPDKTRNTVANLYRAARYLDTHMNNKQKVVNTIEGLTTIPGWIKDDHIVWQNLNPTNVPPYEESISYLPRMSGLRKDDTFYMEGGYIQVADSKAGSDNLFGAMTRSNGWIATPVSGIKVGKAVTVFDIFFHASQVERVYEVGTGEMFETVVPDKRVGNPYYNHAVSIAVEPGDVWNGEIVQGKVYVNFTEAQTHSPEQRIFVERHQVDVGSSISNGDSRYTVTPEMARFNWSTHYGAWGKSEITLTNRKSPDWGWSAGGVRGSGLSGGGAQAINWSWAPAENVVVSLIETPPMSNRAVRWLASDIVFDGYVRVDVSSADPVSAQAHDVVVETSRSTTVELATARLQVEAFNDADTIDPDVNVLVPTGAVVVKAHHPTEIVELDTATMILGTSDLEGVEFEMDWSEVMVMTLPRQGLILILEDN